MNFKLTPGQELIVSIFGHKLFSMPSVWFAGMPLADIKKRIHLSLDVPGKGSGHVALSDGSTLHIKWRGEGEKLKLTGYFTSRKVIRYCANCGEKFEEVISSFAPQRYEMCRDCDPWGTES